MATLEKRTSENKWYSIDCTNSLDTAETISSITSIAADQTGLIFSGQKVNTSQCVFSDGTIANIGKVIQVQISGGTITIGQFLKDRRPGVQYTIRANYVTSKGSSAEATVLLNLTDTPLS